LPELGKGDRVRHADFGSGTVVAKLPLDRVRVVFESAPGLPRTIERAGLEALAPALPADNAPQERHAPPPAPELGQPTRECSLDQATAWQTLEALRLGVVPAIGVQEYTIGREQELSDIEQLLTDGAGCRVLWGDYGAGKTHLLEAAQQLALDRGFATARVTLDPTERAMHHPLRLYRHIVESVQTHEQGSAGFEEIFEALIDSPKHFEPRGERASRFFSPYLHVLRHGDVEQIGWLRDYVRGDNIGSDEVNAILNKLRWQGERVLRMSDFRTYGRMYIHLVGTLAAWCADGGARGLVVLFDEVERVDSLSPDNQRYAFEVLQHYAAVTMREEDLSFHPETLYKGGHRVHRAIPLRFRNNQPLTSVFALTPLEEIRVAVESLTKSGRYDLVLSPLGSDRLGELIGRIATVYERAYGFELTYEARAAVTEEIEHSISEGHDSFRDAVRAAAFLFDRERLGNGTALHDG